MAERSLENMPAPAAPPAAKPSGAGGYFIAALLWPVVFISLPFTLIFWFAGPDDFEDLSRIIYHEWGYFTFSLELTQFSLWAMRILYGCLLIASTTILLRSRGHCGQIWSGTLSLIEDLWYLSRSLLPAPGTSPPLAWLAAVLLLIGILVLRICFMIGFPLGPDEVASHDFFVSQGWLAVTSFYPMPNNHILFSAVCRLFHLVHADLIWSMRVPGLIFGAMGGLLLFLILLRAQGLFVAIVTTAYFSLSYYGIHIHFAGRGYSLTILFTVLAFFALVRALRTSHPPRWTWVVFAASSVLGLYTVPTHLYAFASMLVIAGIVFMLQSRWSDLAGMGVCVAVVATFTVLLYLPVIAVSGVDALVANRYLTTMSMGDAAGRLPAHVVHLENVLTGISVMPVAIVFITPLIAAWVILSHRHDNAHMVLLGWACVGMIVLPYLFGLLQRVHPPERVLFFKQMFLMLLFALVCRLLFERIRVPLAARMLLVLPVIPYAIHQSRHLTHLGTLLEAELAPIRDLQEFILETRPSKVQVHHTFAQFYLLHHARQQKLKVQLFSDDAWMDDADLIVTERGEEGTHSGVDTTVYEVKYANHALVAYGRIGSPVDAE
jgi:hypothetical protein